MFENEIKFINDFTLNKIKDLGSSFTIVQFLSAEIHPSIKKYVESEINYLIHQDRKKLIENSLFDYSGSKISNYFNLIADEIKKSKKISFEEIKNITLQAVSFNANFVVRPKWALSKLIFGNSKSVSLNDIEMMLNYTYYYEYLGNVFLAYLNKKKIMNISATEFELIMNKIDRELFTLHQSKLVDNALYAIADFYNIGGLNKSTLPVEAIEMFLKEKNLTELLFKLKRGFPAPTKKKTDIDDIRKAFYSDFPLENTKFKEEGSDDSEKIEPEVEVKVESHFDNPLKEEFQSMEKKSEEMIEEEQVQSSDSESLFVEENQIEEKIIIDDKNKEPVFEEPAEEEAESETEHQDLPLEDKVILEETLVDENKGSDLSEEEQKNEQQFEEVIEVTEDEKLLDAFIEETKDQTEDEEIIIIDDKEEDNVMEFFEQETEITIDDQEDKINEDYSKAIVDETSVQEKTEENIEDKILEKTINEENKSEEIVIEEKIEFERVDKDDLSEESKIKDFEKAETEELSSKINKENFDDIFSFLTTKEIDRIIKNLFNSDSEDFANTVEKLSKCNSFDEANEILTNIFKYARIKPHSKEATALTRAVTKYFEQGN